MPIVWDESLSTHVKVVDDQHKMLIQKINELNDAMAQGKGRKELEPLLEFLGNYARQHFAEEEAEMDRLKCPAAAANRAAHSAFIQTFGRIHDRLKAEGPSALLAIEVKKELGDWLVNHIKGIDTQLRLVAK